MTNDRSARSVRREEPRRGEGFAGSAGGSGLRAACWAGAVLLALLGSPAAAGQEPDFLEMSIEELMAVEVTSVSRRSESVFDAAAAVTVITAEDIRRSGARNIPDLLRQVPGVQVASIDANKWAVSARGCNSRFANKLLVLIDGRTVYTPAFAGVYWDSQDLVLEDIERIEVIRGPGGSLWGANAVNGVINIITRPARETPGTYVCTGGGSEERGFAEFRHGGGLGESGAYRVSGRWFARDAWSLSGAEAWDDWTQGSAHLRADYALGEKDELTFGAGGVWGEADGRFLTWSLSPPYHKRVDGRSDTRVGMARAAWTHRFRPDSRGILRAYIDGGDRDLTAFQDLRRTVDLDWQHDLMFGSRHEVVWGAGFRSTRDRILGGAVVTTRHERHSEQIYSGFLQDRYALFPGRFDVILGTKVEHADDSEAQWQPTLRALWRPLAAARVWAAVGRAVRNPSIAETDAEYVISVQPTAQFPVMVQVKGDPRFRPERVTTFEGGARAQIASSFLLDITTFRNQYRGLRGSPATEPEFKFEGEQAYLLITTPITNLIDGVQTGTELSARWDPRPQWRVLAAYTHLHWRYDDPALAVALGEPVGEPEHAGTVRVSWDPAARVEVDATLHLVSKLPVTGVPAWSRLDLGLSWSPIAPVNVRLVGQNLLAPTHQEYNDTYLEAHSNVQRGWYGSLAWRF